MVLNGERHTQTEHSRGWSSLVKENTDTTQLRLEIVGEKKNSQTQHSRGWSSEVTENRLNTADTGGLW